MHPSNDPPVTKARVSVVDSYVQGALFSLLVVLSAVGELAVLQSGEPMLGTLLALALFMTVALHWVGQGSGRRPFAVVTNGNRRSGSERLLLCMRSHDVRIGLAHDYCS